jgi:putative ATP-binding cassette transporter
LKNENKKLSIASLLYRQSPALLIFAILIGAVSGVLYSLIIPFLLRELNGQSAATGQAATAGLGIGLFFGVCFLILVTKAISVILVNNIAKSAMAELRLAITRKINRMMIDEVECVGFPRLLTILTDDVTHVASAAIAIPMLLVGVVTIIGMLGYLAVLNAYVFGIVLCAIFAGACMFRIPAALATKLYDRARTFRDAIQEGIRGLVMGVYELKLNKNKSASYITEELEVPQYQSVKLEKTGDAIFHLAGTSSDLLSFFIIGFIVFVLPQYMHLPASQNYGVVMALLFITGPVTLCLSTMQQLKVGQVALGRIQDLTEMSEETVGAAVSSPFGKLENFRVDRVTYKYPGRATDDENSFALSPVSLSFQPETVNFIVGGNGSGKTTLSKLLSLHYRPATGGVYFNGMLVDQNNVAAARLRIGVIFSNYYLFAKLYRDYSKADEKKIASYLESLGLSGKTEFVNGRFTTTKLSDGQRRRLALLVALLEDKDIYIFDEWAADQDPDFKRIFYREILKDMKADNKLVIVITHDDRYFECADRVIFMEEGQVTHIEGAHTGNESIANPAFDAMTAASASVTPISRSKQV